MFKRKLHERERNSKRGRESECVYEEDEEEEERKKNGGLISAEQKQGMRVTEKNKVWAGEGEEAS